MTSTAAGALAQYGAIGIMLLAVGALARTMITREQARADRLESEVNRLNGIVQDRTIPALLTATQATHEAIGPEPPGSVPADERDQPGPPAQAPADQ